MSTQVTKHGDIVDAPNEAATLERMRARLSGVVSDEIIEAKAPLVFQINELKRQRNAVILGHNYMEPIVFHTISDFVGDSLQLARISARTDADIILFCGVKFMAETAKVLNPEKMVLIPSADAGCSLAEGISAADVRALRRVYPDAVVVTYVNTYADVKAESDYGCTSGNSSAVVRHLLDEGHKQIAFLPDEYLARNTAAELGLEFVLAPESLEEAGVNAGIDPEKPTVIGWRARCEVHEMYTVEDVEKVREGYPDAAILAHPECHPDVIARVDCAGSTKGMIDYVCKEDAPRYMLFTELSMAENLAAEFPDKTFVHVCRQECKYMKYTTLEDVLASLENEQVEVDLSADIIERARLPIDRMLAIT